MEVLFWIYVKVAGCGVFVGLMSLVSENISYQNPDYRKGWGIVVGSSVWPVILLSEAVKMIYRSVTGKPLI